MRKTTRHILFFFFAGAFLVSAPLVVLYTAGYRLSLNNYRVLETGAIAADTTPNGATIFIDDKKESAKSPTVIQNVLPHDTNVRFEKNGYLPWEQTVPVTSGATTYVTAILYADAEAEVLEIFSEHAISARSANGRYLMVLEIVSDRTAVTLYDVVTRYGKFITVLSETPEAYTLRFSAETNIFIIEESGNPILGITQNGESLEGTSLSLVAERNLPVVIENNGSNTEVRSSRDTTMLLALLPQGTYELLSSDDEYAVLQNERGIVTVVSLSEENAVTLDVPASVWAWLPDLHLFAWSDGIEVNVFAAEEGTRTFLTRQSDLITTLAWHPTGEAVIVGTGEHVTAIDRNAFLHRVSTLLLDADGPVIDLWLDRSGKNLYVLQNINDQVTLYRRKLVK